MNSTLARLWRLCRKEIRETLRDRRTIITLLLMPLLVYPLLSMTLHRFLLANQDAAKTGYLIAMGSDEDFNLLNEWLSDPRSTPPTAIQDASGEMATFQAEVFEDPRQAVKDNLADVLVEMPGDRQVVVAAQTGDSAGESARRVLLERFTWLELNEGRRVLSKMLGEEEFQKRTWKPKSEDLPGVEGPPLLASIVPLVLVLMTITGAVYPSIDLTAGERERGTMEALIASPVSRTSILFAKYVAVVTVALLTAVANLVSMFATLQVTGLMQMLVGEEGGFPLVAILQIFGLLVLFSMFFSAVLLSLTSFARSFKEAQAYLIPIMLMSLTPAIFALMPGVTLEGPMSVLPLLNIVLLARDQLSGGADPSAAGIAILTTILYAAAALSVAARLFGNDAVRNSSEQSFGATLRRPRESRNVPTVSAAAMTLAILAPLFFLLSGIAAQSAPNGLVPRLSINALVLAALFAGLPILSAWYGRNRFFTTFRMQMPNPLAFLGAVFLGFSLWVAAQEIFLFGEWIGLGGLNESSTSRATEFVEQMKGIPLWIVLLTISLTPAICEEVCFRGFLFSALEHSGEERFSRAKVVVDRRPTRALYVILVTAIAFGLFHLVGTVLLVERLMPSTFMGLAIGWVAWRTKSIWPGMVMHAIHNGFLMIVGRYPETFAPYGLQSESETHLPWPWLLGASLAALIGFGLIYASSYWSSSKSSMPNAPSLDPEDTADDAA